MLKKTVTYKNPFDPENEITEDLYFNLTRAELVDLEAYYQDEGGLDARVKMMNGGQNAKGIMSTFKEIIGRSYGERQGGKFLKNDQITQQFLASEAYSTVLVGILTGDEDPIAFIRGILPADADSVIDQVQQNPDATPSEIARAQSELKMQGRKLPAEKPVSVEKNETPDFSIMTPSEFATWQSSQNG